MDDNVDNEVLISLIQTKPVLWDKTLPIYKDRNATKNAWKDVCCEINTNFEDMEDKEKNEFGKAVIRRWTNLRDAFSKSKKKQQDFKKSGSATPNAKKYVYNDQMQFLNKVYELRETVDSLGNTHNSEDGLADNDVLQPASDVNEGVVRRNQVTNKEKMAERFGNRKRRNPDEVELRMLKALEPEKPNSHMSFFQGVIPHLNKFDDSEVLEFQMGVLRVISTINEKKRTSRPPTFPHHPQQYSQSASFPNLQPSCSSYFNPPSTYQTSFSQQHQSFDSQNNPIPNPNNLQNYTFGREQSVTQRTQTVTQYYHDFSQSSAATSPDIYPTDDLSPAPSGSPQSTIDFTT